MKLISRSSVNAGRWTQWRAAFSLVEMLVAVAVLGMIMLFMATLMESTRQALGQAARSDEFREGRRAFEALTRTLAKATLNTYWDYLDAAGASRTVANSTTFQPVRYVRFSELRFRVDRAANLFGSAGNGPHDGTLAGSGVVFQAPLGITGTAGYRDLNTSLNTVGFYIENCTDPDRPTMLSGANPRRWRLFQMVEPTENLTVLSITSSNPRSTSTAWYQPRGAKVRNDKLADNVVALVILPEYRTAAGTKTAYQYSSAPTAAAIPLPEENNLPISLRVALVVISKNAAQRMESEGIQLNIDTLFTNPADFEADLNKVTDKLVSYNLAYRVFSSTVPLEAEIASYP